jgi:hypothetical protein
MEVVSRNPGESVTAASRPLGWRFAAATAAGAIVAAAMLGLPTDVIPNPWFTRMTPVRPLDVVLLVLTSLLVGALLATYVVAPAGARAPARAGMAGGTLGWLAIGCPVCNKVVVAVLGLSGASTYFVPVQPILGVASVLLAAWALRARLRSVSGICLVVAADPASR